MHSLLAIQSDLSQGNPTSSAVLRCGSNFSICGILLDGIAYTFGSGGGLITYTLPHVIDTKDDKVALGFSTTQSDAPIVKVTSANTKDFIEMRLVSIDSKTIDNLLRA